MITRLLSIILVISLTSFTFAQNPNFHIYLAYGQSNMEGQGTIEAQDTIGVARFKTFQAVDCPNLDRIQAQWYTATPPTCQCYSKLSPVDYFGRTMAEKLPDSISVGIINVSVAGCDIRLFNKKLYSDYDSTYVEPWFLKKIKGYNGNPYQHLIDLAQLAQKDGVIKGVLLHQGETNTGDELWPYYVKDIYKDLIKDLQLDKNEVPLLAGQVVSLDQEGKCARMNTIIDRLPKVVKTAHVISAVGCTDKTDNIHFDSAGYRELGKRYALKMLELLK